MFTYIWLKFPSLPSYRGSLPIPGWTKMNDLVVWFCYIHGTGVFTYVWLICMVNVGKYSIHGASGGFKVMGTSSIPHEVDIKLKPLSCTTFTAYRSPTHQPQLLLPISIAEIQLWKATTASVPVWCSTMDNDIEGLGIYIYAKNIRYCVYSLPTVPCINCWAWEGSKCFHQLGF